MKNLFLRIYELLLEREREMRRKTDVPVVVVDGGGGKQAKNYLKEMKFPSKKYILFTFLCTYTITLNFFCCSPLLSSSAATSVMKYVEKLFTLTFFNVHNVLRYIVEISMFCLFFHLSIIHTF